MATVPTLAQQVYADAAGHSQKEDERIDRVLPSREPVGMVFETDPHSPAYTGEPKESFPFDAYDLEIDAG